MALARDKQITPGKKQHFQTKLNKTRIVGKACENEQIQEYRPSQQGRKKIEKMNSMIYNCFFQYCETLGTAPLREYNENRLESWINGSSDSESQTSQLKQEKCPTNVLRKIRKHGSVNLICLKQTAKRNTLPEDRNEKTAETIKKQRKISQWIYRY